MRRLLPFVLLPCLLLAFYQRPAAQGGTGECFAAFVAATDALLEEAEDYRAGLSGVGELRERLATTRRAYKSVSWLVEYYYPAYSSKHFNGAPLLKAEKSGTQSTVQPPEGLQVLDELAYAEAIAATQFQILARTLANHAHQLAAEVKARAYPLEEVVEALRLELVRIPTLYLTGFDTPGSLAGIPEAAAALRAMAEVLRQQETLRAYPAFTESLAGFAGAAAGLAAAPDFDTFDRLTFQRDHLNPLYRSLGNLQRQAGLPAVVRFPSGRNPNAQQLYADDFLDPYAFTDLRREEDSPALRELGRTLFFDAGLSGGGQLSCASCHQPERGYADGVARSPSNRLGETVARNAPTLLNAVYADRYFYDLRAFTLEQQAEHVIFNAAEFATEYGAILAKLRLDAGYRARFREAFGDRTIDRERFSAALAAFVLSLRSFNSPFDRYARGETDDLDPRARAGFNLFMGKAACGTCHFAPTFSGLVPPFYTENESEILGLTESPHRFRPALDPDRGRAAGGVHPDAVWIFERSFKTPTVRNAALTAPYFHNGAFETLELVVDFYDHGGGAGLGLEVINQTLPADSLHLTPGERESLVVFLHALTDTAAVSPQRR